MARTCYVVIAHNEPVNLLGLIGSLWNPHDAFLLWIDAHAAQSFRELARAACRFGDNVHCSIGRPMVWGGFSIVETTLMAYAQLREQVGEFSHLVLCSGTHIALRHPDAIYDRIRSSAGWIDTVQVTIPDGGLRQLDSMTLEHWWQHMLRRIRYRYAEVPGIGMLVEGERQTWNARDLLVGSQWHVLRSDLVDFIVQHEARVRETFHDVVVADEHAFQWIAAQSPMAAQIKRGKHVLAEWQGASPKRWTLTEARAKAAAPEDYLFVRKASRDLSIDAWSDWAADTLANRAGADRLRLVGAALDASAVSPRVRAAAKLPAPLAALLQSVIKALSASRIGGAQLQRVTERRCLVATRQRLGEWGPVWMLCAIEPGLGVAIVPCVHRPSESAVGDPLRPRPGLPDHSEFVNLPLEGRLYWSVTEAASSADINAMVEDLDKHLSRTDAESPIERRVSNRVWLTQIVKGRSFADVGGLWGTVNERVSAALLAGASEASMLDVAPLGHSLWKDFDARCQSLKVSGYKRVCVDVTRAGLRAAVGRFDVVHCSGVIYHVPDLVGFVRNLMSITVQHLIIQGMVVAEHIENEFGTLDLSGGRCLFVPLLGDAERKIVRRHFEQLDLRVPHISSALVSNWFPDGNWNYGPWSWLLTPAFLRGLVQVCGLSVVDEGFVWEHKAYSLLCRMPLDTSPQAALPH